MSKTVLVAGAGGPAGYNFIDSIKRADEKITTIGTDINPYHLLLSNADIKYLVPPLSDKKKYILAINKIIKKHRVDILHAQPDPEVFFIAEYRQLIKTKTFLPSMKTMKVCQDKMKTIDILRKSNIPVAETYHIKNIKDLQRAFKTIKKNNTTLWLRAIKGAGSKAAIPIKEIYHAIFWIDYWSKYKNLGYGNFMLSEMLPGKEYAFQSVWKNGKLIVSQARERIEYVFGNLTLSGQTSSPAVAVTVINDTVNDIATRAVLAVDKNATGVFCIDLKENKKQIPCVIEINAGRFFTTSNFFAHAGCNMPYVYCKLALEEKISKVKQYNNLNPDIYWVRLIDMGTKMFSAKQLQQIEKI